MSMTREEAIKWLEEIVQDTDTYWGSCSKALQKELDEQKEVFLLALTALRPITREQVEKVWKGEWIGTPNMGVYDIACSKCGYSTGIRFWSSDFYPHCGAPMTDKAVDMVMERINKMEGTGNGLG